MHSQYIYTYHIHVSAGQYGPGVYGLYVCVCVCGEGGGVCMYAHVHVYVQGVWVLCVQVKAYVI